MKKYFVIALVLFAGILASQPKQVSVTQPLPRKEMKLILQPAVLLQEISPAQRIEQPANKNAAQGVDVFQPRIDGYNAGMMPQANAATGIGRSVELYPDDNLLG